MAPAENEDNDDGFGTIKGLSWRTWKGATRQGEEEREEEKAEEDPEQERKRERSEER